LCDDLVQWEGDFGLNGMSDADDDGDSDGRDFMIWQSEFGIKPILAAGVMVPEPPTGIMLLIGMVTLLTGGRTFVSKLNSA
jgi:hypothetical protein